MVKALHEIRDPVHTFIRVDTDERKVLDSAPVQRLRHIHQLALTYLVYPGATHKRFEHSLGVMELAGRVFDVVTDRQNVHPRVQEILPELNGLQRDYWRRALRMAALCHDLGHLPFSHAAEHDLLPNGWDHERLTVALIHSPQMAALWQQMTPPLRASDVAKLSVGKKKLPNEPFTDWEALLSEIIVGDAFGVDRMDYLLRDSLHAGVSYGRFDHFRLIDTLRILPGPPSGDESGSLEPQLGVEEGGLRSAEALLLARYFMYSQVYFHPVRRIYDAHLKDFLRDWLADKGGTFPTDVERHLQLTDNEVLAAISAAARDRDAPGHDAGGRITARDHYKVLWRRNPGDLKRNPDAGQMIADAAVSEFGASAVRRERASPSAPIVDFPVLLPDENEVASAQSLSDVLAAVPTAAIDFVFIRRNLEKQAGQWLQGNRDRVLAA